MSFSIPLNMKKNSAKTILNGKNDLHQFFVLLLSIIAHFIELTIDQCGIGSIVGNLNGFCPPTPPSFNWIHLKLSERRRVGSCTNDTKWIINWMNIYIIYKTFYNLQLHHFAKISASYLETLKIHFWSFVHLKKSYLVSDFFQKNLLTRYTKL